MPKKIKEAITRLRSGIFMDYHATMSWQQLQHLTDIGEIVKFIERTEKRRKKK